MMKSDVTVVFDNPDTIHEAGQVVSGHVDVILTQDVKVKAVLLKLHGASNVSWNERRSYTKGSSTVVCRKNTETYLDHTMVLRKKESKDAGNRRMSKRPSVCLQLLSSDSEMDVLLIPTGKNSYPFRFTLPRDIPSSFEGKWGYVKYFAKAVLERPWKFDIEREIEFKINSLVDLNAEQELLRPIGAMEEFRAGAFCCSSGLVNVDMRISRRGYISGENIPFFVEVENNSRKKMYDVKVALIQHATFRAGDKTKKTVAQLTSLSSGEVKAGSAHVWDTDSLLIPPNLPPSTGKTKRTIQLKYTVTVLVTHSTWTDDFQLSTTVVIGTGQFHSSTIQSYLQQIGQTIPSTDSPNSLRWLSRTQLNAHRDSLASSKSDISHKSRPRMSVPMVVLTVPKDRASLRRGSAAGVLQRSPHGRRKTSEAVPEEKSTSPRHKSTTGLYVKHKNAPRNKSDPAVLQRPSKSKKSIEKLIAKSIDK